MASDQEEQLSDKLNNSVEALTYIAQTNIDRIKLNKKMISFDWNFPILVYK